MVKRAFDVVVAGGALLVLWPVLVVVAALVWLEDRGPIVYSGVRIGRGGQPFRMHKFRTMVPNADRIGGPSTAGDDPRLTRVGKTLRRYKLDELPQMFNVLKGDMSLVGPRPEVKHYVDMYSEDERLILSVRPGVTDWASIRFRDEAEILRGSADPEQAYMELIRPEKIKLALAYARDASFMEDLRILAATARILVRD
jgi:lipopolysaccharide/colanic/teichoic acid biosynthesis glycosyltransferase